MKLSNAVKAALVLMQQAVVEKSKSDTSAGNAFDLCRKGIAAYDATLDAKLKGKPRKEALRDWAEDIEGVKITLSDYIAKITAAYAVPGITAKIGTKGKNPSVRTVDTATAKSKGDFAKLAEAARIKMGITRAKSAKKSGDKKAEAKNAKAIKEATDKAIEKAVKEATGDGTSFYRTIIAVLTAGSAQSYLLPNLKEALEECGYAMVRASANKDVDTSNVSPDGKTARSVPRRVNGKAQSASQ